MKIDKLGALCLFCQGGQEKDQCDELWGPQSICAGLVGQEACGEWSFLDTFMADSDSPILSGFPVNPMKNVLDIIKPWKTNYQIYIVPRNVFQLLIPLIVEADGVRKCFELFSYPLCENAFCMILGVNNKRVLGCKPRLLIIYHWNWWQALKTLGSPILKQLHQNLMSFLYLWWNLFNLVVSLSAKVQRLASGLESNSLPTDRRRYNGRQPSKSLSVESFMAYVYFHMVSWTKSFTVPALVPTNITIFFEYSNLRGIMSCSHLVWMAATPGWTIGRNTNRWSSWWGSFVRFWNLSTRHPSHRMNSWIWVSCYCCITLWVTFRTCFSKILTTPATDTPS